MCGVRLTVWLTNFGPDPGSQPMPRDDATRTLPSPQTALGRAARLLLELPPGRCRRPIGDLHDEGFCGAATSPPAMAAIARHTSKGRAILTSAGEQPGLAGRGRWGYEITPATTASTSSWGVGRDGRGLQSMVKRPSPTPGQRRNRAETGHSRQRVGSGLRCRTRTWGKRSWMDLQVGPEEARPPAAGRCFWYVCRAIDHNIQRKGLDSRVAASRFAPRVQRRLGLPLRFERPSEQGECL
jgi:hypothetical protein